MLYYVMRSYRDGYGTVHHIRHNMRRYTLNNAKRIADTVRGGFVCPLGKTEPCYVGQYQ